MSATLCLSESMQIFNKNPKLNYVLGITTLWVVSYATVCADYPKPYSPYSFVVVIPLMALYDLFGGGIIAMVLGTMIVPLFFSIWCFPLIKMQNKVPKRTAIVTIVLVTLSAIFIFSSWKYGVQYQGTFHTITIYFFNVLLWVLMLLIYLKNIKKQSFTLNFLFHWVLFAWFGWVAFPWLGELL